MEPAAAAAAAAAGAGAGGGGDGGVALVTVSRAECAYARCYCEENVFHLCARLAEALASSSSSEAPPPRVSALFISNARKCVPIWGQRREQGEEEAEEDEPVLWDYHVVCLVEEPHGATTIPLIYDLDTTLEPFPCPAPVYVDEAFRPHVPIRGDFRQRFRLVPLPRLRRVFASDRSHMRRPDGGWNAPPPPWPPIRGPDAESAMTLPRFWDVAEDEDGEFGTVFSLSGLMRRLGMEGVLDVGEEDEEEGE